MRSLLLCLVLVCVQVSGQVLLRVDTAPATMITAEALAKLPRHTASLSEHGKQISYEGVLLHDVLAQNGVEFGKGLHGKQLASYVTALANDGYEVVFSLAEFDPTITDESILLADKREGKRLTAEEGPLRIVVPQDHRAARSLKMVREIDVVELRK